MEKKYGNNKFQNHRVFNCVWLVWKTEVCHSYYENMHNTQQAIKWAGMHKTVTVKGILCDDCFIKKNNKISFWSEVCGLRDKAYLRNVRNRKIKREEGEIGEMEGEEEVG